MSTDPGLLIPSLLGPMTLTPLPSFETAESAISKIIAPAEGYGHSGNVYPDPVSGLDIGYGIQLIGPNGTGGALTPNNGNVAIVLSAMGVPQQYMADAMAAVLGADRNFKRPIRSSSAPCGSRNRPCVASKLRGGVLSVGNRSASGPVLRAPRR